ncbi:hypothetical protein V8E36_003618 [Tilletia maclaganii]
MSKRTDPRLVWLSSASALQLSSGQAWVGGQRQAQALGLRNSWGLRVLHGNQAASTPAYSYGRDTHSHGLAFHTSSAPSSPSSSALMAINTAVTNPVTPDSFKHEQDSTDDSTTPLEARSATGFGEGGLVGGFDGGYGAGYGGFNGIGEGGYEGGIAKGGYDGGKSGLAKGGFKKGGGSGGSKHALAKHAHHFDAAKAAAAKHAAAKFNKAAALDDERHRHKGYKKTKHEHQKGKAHLYRRSFYGSLDGFGGGNKFSVAKHTNEDDKHKAAAAVGAAAALDAKTAAAKLHHDALGAKEFHHEHHHGGRD